MIPNATGHRVPAMSIFPRESYRHHFTNDFPTGSGGIAYPSGWMTRRAVVTFVTHVLGHVRSSRGDKLFVILNNTNRISQSMNCNRRTKKALSCYCFRHTLFAVIRALLLLYKKSLSTLPSICDIIILYSPFLFGVTRSK